MPIKNYLSSFSYDNESFVSFVIDSGRVKVFVRVRPPRPQENSRKEPIAVNVQELSSQVICTQKCYSAIMRKLEVPKGRVTVREKCISSVLFYPRFHSTQTQSFLIGAKGI